MAALILYVHIQLDIHLHDIAEHFNDCTLYNDSPYILTIATTIKICTSTSACLHSLIRSITVVPYYYTCHDIPK